LESILWPDSRSCDPAFSNVARAAANRFDLGGRRMLPPRLLPCFINEVVNLSIVPLCEGFLGLLGSFGVVQERQRVSIFDDIGWGDLGREIHLQS
jgi:hypothetical protein